MAEALLGVQKQDELPKTLLPFTENALRVLARRYLKKTEDSRPAEAPEDMLARVAKNIAQADLFTIPRPISRPRKRILRINGRT